MLSVTGLLLDLALPVLLALLELLDSCPVEVFPAASAMLNSLDWGMGAINHLKKMNAIANVATKMTVDESMVCICGYAMKVEVR